MTEPGSGPARFNSEVLDERRHLTAAFDCGEPELNAWLVEHAAHAGRMNTARTFVWTMPRNDNVVAYYALSAHLLASEDSPRRVARGGPRQLPAVLLAKLALASQWQGDGLGAELLVDALRRIVTANEKGPAARVVIVDALHVNAAAFYTKYGFTPTPNDPLRLIQKMSDITAVPGLSSA